MASPEAEDRPVCVGHKDFLGTGCQGTDQGIVGLLNAFDGGLSTQLRSVLAESRACVCRVA